MEEEKKKPKDIFFYRLSMHFVAISLEGHASKTFPCLDALKTCFRFYSANFPLPVCWLIINHGLVCGPFWRLMRTCGHNSPSSHNQLLHFIQCNNHLIIRVSSYTSYNATAQAYNRLAKLNQMPNTSSKRTKYYTQNKNSNYTHKYKMYAKQGIQSYPKKFLLS